MKLLVLKIYDASLYGVYTLTLAYYSIFLEVYFMYCIVFVLTNYAPVSILEAMVQIDYLADIR